MSAGLAIDLQEHSAAAGFTLSHRTTSELSKQEDESPTSGCGHQEHYRTSPEGDGAVGEHLSTGAISQGAQLHCQLQTDRRDSVVSATNSDPVKTPFCDTGSPDCHHSTVALR
ncbi:hypothetical protein R1flu_002019 [Riccia fluitans]|uniref:Uncharacterized protein n=1 Tax=Riccia fluitans TaxID=41844 RepID=A0ABD1Y8U0_9MARC